MKSYSQILFFIVSCTHGVVVQLWPLSDVTVYLQQQIVQVELTEYAFHMCLAVNI